MHRQVASLLSTSSHGRLAKLGNALGAREIDIETTGGAEWKHSGPVTITLKKDWGVEPDQLPGFAEVMAQEEFPWLAFRTIEIEVEDAPGKLGEAATALGDVNIYAVTVLGSSGTKALVGLGVRPSMVNTAITRLRAFNARLRRHPNDDPDGDGWWDAWDDRTERLLPYFDDQNVSPNDPMFYELQTAD